MATSHVLATGARVHAGRLALVTGGARGIGEAIVRNLAAKGADVCIVYKTAASDAAAAALAAAVQTTHRVRAIGCRADVATPAGVAGVLAACRRAFAAPRLRVDLLVHCAAQFHTAPLAAVSAADFHAVYATNVLGPLLLTQAVAPHLPTDRSGRVVNVSSVGARLGHPGLTLYGGTKGALEAMTRTWARELAERATVNAVSPGAVHTDMWRRAGADVKAFQGLYNPTIPLAAARDCDTDEVRDMARLSNGRVAYPAEIAGIVAMCCSPEAGWMTGSVVMASGGQAFAH